MSFFDVGIGIDVDVCMGLSMGLYMGVSVNIVVYVSTGYVSFGIHILFCLQMFTTFVFYSVDIYLIGCLEYLV